MDLIELFTLLIVIIFVLAALLTTVRIITGPSVLDRVVATDVIVSIVVCALGLQIVLSDGSTTLPILISLSLVGFMGSVAVARFVARDRDYPVDFGDPEDPDDPGEEADPDDDTWGDDHPDDDGPAEDIGPSEGPLDEPPGPGRDAALDPSPHRRRSGADGEGEDR